MKRPLPFKKMLLVFILFLTGVFSFSQTGYISGIIEDADQQPLPGVSIRIKGKNIGTQTNFDGDYRIKCEVGDILVISYLGQKTREIKVTAALFGENQVTTAIKKIAVEPILDSTYLNAVRNKILSFLWAPNIEESSKTYAGKGYLRPDRFKKISKTENQVKLTYFNPDIYFEVGASSRLGAQFVQQRNLPETQNSYAQGIPFNGMNTHFGPDTGVPFSYGPKINTLEYDGSNYPFDPHGRLVLLGEGNGGPASIYKNNIFKTTITTSNTIFFNISEDNFYGFEYFNTSKKDVYGKERSSTDEYVLKFNNAKNYNDIQWNFLFKYGKSRENQPNINGFQNNLLLNTLATPINFNIALEESLVDGSQRSFSSLNFNNPNWLLNSNENQESTTALAAALKNTFHVSDLITLKSRFSYTENSNRQEFGLYSNTIGFVNGYSSNKVVTNDTFDANLSLDWHPYVNDFNFDIISKILYSNENFDYRLIENYGFSERSFDNPQSTFINARYLSRSTFRWFSKLNLKLLDQNANLTFVNNSFTSTKQNSKWFLPTFMASYDFARGWYSGFLHELKLSASFGYDVNYVNLFYNNQSHNSLRLTPDQSFSYTTNQDLFASDGVDLEEKRSSEVNLDLGFRLFDQYWDFTATYFSNTTNGSVFPVYENNQYLLKNIADIQNSGMEFMLEVGVYDYHDFRFIPRLIFSTYRTKVLDILNLESRIPIAGFSSISKNLIVGESAGVLVGTAYARDQQNQIRIDTDGFPIVDTNLKTIGDPTPDFNIGFSSTLKWKRLQLDFVIDYQQGGDIWNGTQNVLNYLGRSQQSAIDRTISEYVFQGVNEQGQTNTIPVDFANPENGLAGNRFVRYGFEGIAEEAIVDGSYFNFKSINLSYSFNASSDRPFFRQLKVSVYGTNLFTTSKFKGASPYNGLFDQASSQGLHFFNNPVLSEVGMKVNIKI